MVNHAWREPFRWLLDSCSLTYSFVVLRNHLTLLTDSKLQCFKTSLFFKCQWSKILLMDEVLYHLKCIMGETINLIWFFTGFLLSTIYHLQHVHSFHKRTFLEQDPRDCHYVDQSLALAARHPNAFEGSSPINTPDRGIRSDAHEEKKMQKTKSCWKWSYLIWYWFIYISSWIYHPCTILYLIFLVVRFL